MRLEQLIKDQPSPVDCHQICLAGLDIDCVESLGRDFIVQLVPLCFAGSSATSGVDCELPTVAVQQ